MDASETAEIQRTRRLRRVAMIAVITLVILVLIAVGILGFNTGKSGERNVGPMLLLAVTFGLVIGMILDLDHPQRGLVLVNLTPLTADRQLFGGHDAK